MEQDGLPPLAWFYRERGLGECVLARGRPSICPLEPLLEAVPTGASLLDLGCGNGLFICAAVLAKQADAVGCDVNTRAIAGARAMAARLAEFLAAQKRRGGARFLVAESAEGWPAGPFQVVSAVDVLHHVPPREQMRFIAAAADRVAAGGVFIYKDMANRPFWMATMNRAHDLVMARQWIAYCPIASVIETLRARGLSLIERQDYSRLWYRHQLAVFRRT